MGIKLVHWLFAVALCLALVVSETARGQDAGTLWKYRQHRRRLSGAAQTPGWGNGFGTGSFQAYRQHRRTLGGGYTADGTWINERWGESWNVPSVTLGEPVQAIQPMRVRKSMQVIQPLRVQRPVGAAPATEPLARGEPAGGVVTTAQPVEHTRATERDDRSEDEILASVERKLQAIDDQQRRNREAVDRLRATSHASGAAPETRGTAQPVEHPITTMEPSENGSTRPEREEAVETPQRERNGQNGARRVARVEKRFESIGWEDIEQAVERCFHDQMRLKRLYSYAQRKEVQQRKIEFMRGAAAVWQTRETARKQLDARRNFKSMFGELLMADGLASIQKHYAVIDEIAERESAVAAADRVLKTYVETCAGAEGR